MGKFCGMMGSHIGATGVFFPLSSGLLFKPCSLISSDADTRTT